MATSAALYLVSCIPAQAGWSGMGKVQTAHVITASAALLLFALIERDFFFEPYCYVTACIGIAKQDGARESPCGIFWVLLHSLRKPAASTASVRAL